MHGIERTIRVVYRAILQRCLCNDTSLPAQEVHAAAGPRLLVLATAGRGLGGSVRYEKLRTGVWYIVYGSDTSLMSACLAEQH